MIILGSVFIFFCEDILAKRPSADKYGRSPRARDFIFNGIRWASCGQTGICVLHYGDRAGVQTGQREDEHGVVPAMVFKAGLRYNRHRMILKPDFTLFFF
jgi:hypothetical protein